MKNKKILLAGLAAAVLGLSGLSPIRALADGLPSDGSQNSDSSSGAASGAVGQPAQPVAAAPSDSKQGLDQSSQGDDSATKVIDGAKGGRKAEVDAGSPSTTLEKPKPARAAYRSSLASSTTYRPVEPKAEDSGLATVGKNTSSTWNNAIKPAITTLAPIAAMVGVGIFLIGGVVGLSLPLMLGGALLAIGAVAIGGIVQALF